MTQESIDEFKTGQGTASLTPTPIAADFPVIRHIRITASVDNLDPIFVGISTMKCVDGVVTSGFALRYGDSINIPVDNPSKVYVCGDGDYAWIAV